MSCMRDIIDEQFHCFQKNLNYKPLACEVVIQPTRLPGCNPLQRILETRISNPPVNSEIFNPSLMSSRASS